MKKTVKLSLDLEQLSVESFEIPNGRQVKGTVRAYVCSDFCSVSVCNPTCGIQPASAESECAAFAETRGICNSDVCCV